MSNINSKLKLANVVAAVAIIGFSSNSISAADVSSGDGYEKVVISLKTDPTKDPEPACVALQIGMNLLMSPGGAVPADDVTLFVTTGGVELVNPHNSIHNRAKPKAVCTTPNGINTASLQDLVVGFEGMGGSIMVCPLCAISRGFGVLDPETGEIQNPPTNGAMGDGLSIHNLFLEADKVIDF